MGRRVRRMTTTTTTTTTTVEYDDGMDSAPTGPSRPAPVQTRPISNAAGRFRSAQRELPSPDLQYQPWLWKKSPPGEDLAFTLPGLEKKAPPPPSRQSQGWDWGPAATGPDAFFTLPGYKPRRAAPPPPPPQAEEVEEFQWPAPKPGRVTFNLAVSPNIVPSSSGDPTGFFFPSGPNQSSRDPWGRS